MKTFYSSHIIVNIFVRDGAKNIILKKFVMKFFA